MLKKHARLLRLSFLGLAAFVMLLFGRASIPPFDRDEPRYMEASAQMLRSHDFIDVRFQDAPRYLQPAGIYWLESASTALASALTGQSQERAVWPYRIPSLLAMTASVVLTAVIGGALFGELAGLWAGAILLASVLVMAEGRMATIDSCLLLSILLTQLALTRALKDREADRPTALRVALLYWGAIGCGLMLKGPVVLVPALGTPLALALVERRADLWRRMRPAWGWLVAIAVAMPWFIAIGIVSHGEFFRRAVGHNFLGKVASGQEAHGLPPGYHLLVFVLAFWPGSYFAAAVASQVWRQRTAPAVRYLLCWIIPHWLVFEAIATKLPHYVLPTYPAIAILIAGLLFRGGATWRNGPQSRWGRVLLGGYGVAWCLVGCLLVLAGPVLLWRLEHQISAQALVLAGGALPLIGLSMVLIWRLELQRALLCVLVAAGLLYVELFTFVIPNLNTIWLAPRLAALVEQEKPCPVTRVYSVSFSEPSLVFLLGGQVVLSSPVGAAGGLLTDPACAAVLLATRDRPLLLDALGAQKNRLRAHGQVQGMNYSNGRTLDISLYTLAPEAAAPASSSPSPAATGTP